MKEKNLVILAAGAGTRFGEEGAKQIQEVGHNGEFIMDYSIKDAIAAGFTKVTFIIQKKQEETFRETVGKRFEGKIDINYAFQSTSELFAPSETNKERTKPWGTTHAVLCAQKYITSQCLVINADDYYGTKTFQVAADFMENNNNEDVIATINYLFSNAGCDPDGKKYSEIKRGVVSEENGYVKEIIESKIKTDENNVSIAYPLNTSRESFEVSDNSLVAMNCFVLNPYMLNILSKYFEEFKKEYGNSLTDECLLTECIQDMINKKEIRMKNLITPEKTMGITYPEDLIKFQEALSNVRGDEYESSRTH